MFIYKSKAIKVAGSQADLARMLGIKRQAVNAWPPRKPIPQKRAIQLLKIYGEEAFR